MIHLFHPVSLGSQDKKNTFFWVCYDCAANTKWEVMEAVSAQVSAEVSAQHELRPSEFR